MATPLPLLLLLLLLFLLSATPISSINTTALLSPYPDLCLFAALLSTTAISTDLLPRSAVTILAVPNSLLRPPPPPHLAADILRRHVILQYLSLPDLRRLPSTGKLFTTLFQTTGRATTNSGYLNITTTATNTNSIIIHSSTSNATVLNLIETLPYNISIFTVSSLLIPYDFDIMTSETRPPLGLNITKVLLDGHNFNVAASMLAASGVEQEFEQDEGGAGITLFVPTDDAFSELPSTVKFQSLMADEKADVLRFHVLHSYYPLGSLESIVNPVQPTLATEKIGAGRFTLNISRINGSVAIDTGIVQVVVTRTVFDQNPISVFGVSGVLLPGEMFGKNPISVSKGGGGGGGQGGVVAAPPLVGGFAPDNPAAIYGPSSHLTSPPDGSDDVKSKAGRIAGELKTVSLMVVVYSFSVLISH